MKPCMLFVINILSDILCSARVPLFIVVVTLMIVGLVAEVRDAATIVDENGKNCSFGFI